MCYAPAKEMMAVAPGSRTPVCSMTRRAQSTVKTVPAAASPTVFLSGRTDRARRCLTDSTEAGTIGTEARGDMAAIGRTAAALF